MQPELTTSRLLLRPFVLSDAQQVQQLAGDVRVAEPAASIPHPYPDGAAEAWIASHASIFANRKGVVYAMTRLQDAALIGAISLLEMSDLHHRAELGYWLGHAFWTQGLGSEAAREIVAYAHRELGVTRVVCRCLTRNIGSARVMEKSGLVREGHLVKHVDHKGVFEDLYLYGLNLPGR